MVLSWFVKIPSLARPGLYMSRRGAHLPRHQRARQRACIDAHGALLRDLNLLCTNTSHCFFTVCVCEGHGKVGIEHVWVPQSSRECHLRIECATSSGCKCELKNPHAAMVRWCTSFMNLSSITLTRLHASHATVRLQRAATV